MPSRRGATAARHERAQALHVVALAHTSHHLRAQLNHPPHFRLPQLLRRRFHCFLQFALRAGFNPLCAARTEGAAAEGAAAARQEDDAAPAEYVDDPDAL